MSNIRVRYCWGVSVEVKFWAEEVSEMYGRVEELPPPALPRPREDDVVEVDGRDCTGIILELLSAADITHKNKR